MSILVNFGSSITKMEYTGHIKMDELVKIYISLRYIQESLPDNVYVSPPQFSSFDSTMMPSILHTLPFDP